MRKKLGKRERAARKRRVRMRVCGSLTGGETLKLGSKKEKAFRERVRSFVPTSTSGCIHTFDYVCRQPLKS